MEDISGAPPGLDAPVADEEVQMETNEIKQEEIKPKIEQPVVPERREIFYHPFRSLVSDEKEQIYQRLYDSKFQQYIHESESRTAHQLALAFFRDANQYVGSVLNEFNGRDIVLLDSEDAHNTNTFHLLFTKNCLRHINVTAEEFEDIQLSPSFQTLLLSTDMKLSESSLQKITNFVNGGGLVMSFNKAISIVAQAFPGTIKFKNGETTSDKQISIEIPETDDKSLFLGLENAASRNKVVRFVGTRRVVELGHPAVTVLVKETDPSPCPLIFKLESGAGFVYHILPVGTNEILELRSKELSLTYCKRVENMQNISESTKSAWKAAFSSGLHESFYMAISLLPLLDVIFGILRKHRRGGPAI
eukprot:TRINITY_DN3783_c0_g1_i1.p1 TRINITY_DN3783_c0_g1~~TRINITY_DN3783_c0_g1_i1.p1  ORF type:complete len:361 (-),score=71.13 TRINITY_DN3783_c0_g1_i1:23-1105(-)